MSPGQLLEISDMLAQAKVFARLSSIVAQAVMDPDRLPR